MKRSVYHPTRCIAYATTKPSPDKYVGTEIISIFKVGTVYDKFGQTFDRAPRDIVCSEDQFELFDFANKLQVIFMQSSLYVLPILLVSYLALPTNAGLLTLISASFMFAALTLLSPLYARSKETKHVNNVLYKYAILLSLPSLIFLTVGTLFYVY